MLNPTHTHTYKQYTPTLFHTNATLSTLSLSSQTQYTKIRHVIVHFKHLILFRSLPYFDKCWATSCVRDDASAMPWASNLLPWFTFVCFPPSLFFFSPFPIDVLLCLLFTLDFLFYTCLPPLFIYCASPLCLLSFIFIMLHLISALKTAHNNTPRCVFTLFSAELSLPDLPAYVELHELQAAQCICQKHRGGHCPCAQLQVCLPDGKHHEWVPPRPQL